MFVLSAWSPGPMKLIMRSTQQHEQATLLRRPRLQFRQYSYAASSPSGPHWSLVAAAALDRGYRIRIDLNGTKAGKLRENPYFRAGEVEPLKETGSLVLDTMPAGRKSIFNLEVI